MADMSINPLNTAVAPAPVSVAPKAAQNNINPVNKQIETNKPEAQEKYSPAEEAKKEARRKAEIEARENTAVKEFGPVVSKSADGDTLRVKENDDRDDEEKGVIYNSAQAQAKEQPVAKEPVENFEIPKPAVEAAPVQNEAKPQVNEPVVQQAEMTAQINEAAPVVNEAVQQQAQPMPEPVQAAPEAAQTIQEPVRTTPEPEQMQPQPEIVTPEPMETNPAPATQNTVVNEANINAKPQIELPDIELPDIELPEIKNPALEQTVAAAQNPVAETPAQDTNTAAVNNPVQAANSTQNTAPSANSGNNSLDGISDAELKRMYLQGDISQTDYDKEVQSREAAKEAREAEGEQFSAEMTGNALNETENAITGRAVENLGNENEPEEIPAEVRAQFVQNMEDLS